MRWLNGATIVDGWPMADGPLVVDRSVVSLSLRPLRLDHAPIVMKPLGRATDFLSLGGGQ